MYRFWSGIKLHLRNEVVVLDFSVVGFVDLLLAPLHNVVIHQLFVHLGLVKAVPEPVRVLFVFQGHRLITRFSDFEIKHCACGTDRLPGHSRHVEASGHTKRKHGEG